MWPLRLLKTLKKVRRAPAVVVRFFLSGRHANDPGNGADEEVGEAFHPRITRTQSSRAIHFPECSSAHGEFHPAVATVEGRHVGAF